QRAHQRPQRPPEQLVFAEDAYVEPEGQFGRKAPDAVPVGRVWRTDQHHARQVGALAHHAPAAEPQHAAADPAGQAMAWHSRHIRWQRRHDVVGRWMHRSVSVPVAPGAPLLDRTAFALAGQAALPRAAGGLGRDAFFWRVQAGLDEVGEAFARILAVAVLGAEALRRQHQHAVTGDPAVAPRQQALAHRLRQRRRAGDVETQLDRGGDLVDVLPARPGRTHESFDQLGLGDADGADLDHAGDSRAAGLTPAHATNP